MKASHRIFGIVAATLVTAALIVFTIEYDWMGTLIASDMKPVDTVYRALTIASIPFFVIICAIIAYVLFEFRAKPEDPDDKDGAPFHGSTKIEIIWTIIPTIVVMALGIYAWTVLDKVEAAQPNSMTIKVTGQQFAWNYQYPEENVKTSGDLVVPVNRPLYFEMTSADVIHSFSVPSARVKRDVADGFVTRIRFKPDTLGSYPIVCTELCGIGHATMRSTLRVVTPAQFTAWIAAQKSDKAPSPSGANTDPQTWPGAFENSETAK